MNKSRILKISLLLILIFLGIYVFNLNYECPFKQNFHLACPGCGLTRAFYALLEFDILLAIKYNILAIPLLIFLLISIVVIILEIVFNKNIYFKELFKQLYMNLDFIFLFLLITMAINNIHAI